MTLLGLLLTTFLTARITSAFLTHPHAFLLPTRPAQRSGDASSIRVAAMVEREENECVPAPMHDNEEDPEEDYARKLAAAQAAIAAAREARQKLRSTSSSNNKPLQRYRPPVNGQARISRTDAGTLVVELPRTGINANAVFNGVFSAAWFSAIVPATLAGGAPLLFMLPFWAAGGLVAKTAVVDPFVASTLTIGQYAWSLESLYGGVVTKKRDGPTPELEGAQMEVASVVNGVPQCELRLYGKKGATSMGLGLTQEELEYLADEINDHLCNLKDELAMNDVYDDGLTHTP